MKPSRLPLKTIALILVAAGFAAGVHAQGSMATAPAASVPASANQAPNSAAQAPEAHGLSKADRQFIQKAAMGGLFEVKLGGLAEEKGAKQVQAFGRRMVEDHSKANDELQQLAKAKGVKVPTTLDKSHQHKMQGFQKLSGGSFDRDYMQAMIGDHKETIALFEREAKSGQDSDLKAFAGKTLPTLQEHLQMAETTSKALKAASTASAASGAR